MDQFGKLVKLPDSMIQHSYSEELLFEDLHTLLEPEQVNIVRMKMEGLRSIEVAAKLGVCPATITRKMSEIQDRLECYFDGLI